MGERNLDFDTVINRRNTKSLKYDFAVKRGKPGHALPLWVADMDFKVSSYITDALEDMVSGGIFGYSEGGDAYFEAVKGWMKRQHQWDVAEEWMIKTPGIVFALAVAIRAFTEEGDAVLIQQPVYYPFREVIMENRRKLVDNTLIQGEDGRYVMDYEDFERKIVTEHVKLFILCSPHNPVGRVWTEEELTIVGDICERHHVPIISDEIHSDFVFEGKHHVFASVGRGCRGHCMICTSPSKTFNIAGLQISNIFIADKDMAATFRREMAAFGYSQVSLPGLVACEAAYQYGDEWLAAVLSYIRGNAEFMREYLHRNLPKVKMTRLEGTYLVWLDFRGYGLSDREVDRMILHGAGLWLDGGSMFGTTGDGFQRMNIACPRATLELVLGRLKQVFG